MKKFNNEHLLGFIVLISLSIYLFYLLFTGQITHYVHPKRINMMWFAESGIILLSLYELTKIFTIPSRKVHFKKYMSLCLLLLCGIFALRPTEGQNSQTIVQNKPQVHASSNQEVVLDLINTEENYISTLSQIEANPQSYIGQKIITQGFVYREESFANETFVVARNYMLCCASDVQVVGLMCEGAMTTLQQGEWVKVEGILQTKAYEANEQQGSIPFIQITSISKISEPESPYVY